VARHRESGWRSSASAWSTVRRVRVRAGRRCCRSPDRRLLHYRRRSRDSQLSRGSASSRSCTSSATPAGSTNVRPAAGRSTCSAAASRAATPAGNCRHAAAHAGLERRKEQLIMCAFSDSSPAIDAARASKRSPRSSRGNVAAARTRSASRGSTPRGRLRAYKQCRPAHRSPGVLAMARGRADAHRAPALRDARRRGEHNINNHPHPADGGWIVHNGVVRNYERLVRDRRLCPVSECDSEVLGLLIERSDVKIAPAPLRRRGRSDRRRAGDDGIVVAAVRRWSSRVAATRCRSAKQPMASILPPTSSRRTPVHRSCAMTPSASSRGPTAPASSAGRSSCKNQRPHSARCSMTPAAIAEADHELRIATSHRERPDRRACRRCRRRR
jgi:hypothetical protein